MASFYFLRVHGPRLRLGPYKHAKRELAIIPPLDVTFGIHWKFAYWPRGNVQLCIFARGEFVLPFRRPISVALFLPACLEVWNFLLKFRVAKCTLFQHV